MRAVVSWVINLFFPQRCCLCGKVIEWRQTMCADCCRDAPTVFPPVCEWCGRGEDKCSCRQRRRSFERCVMPFYYEDLGKSGVALLKTTADYAIAQGMAAEMAEVIRREYGGIPFDCLTAVPQYFKDERKKGYNPAAMLAKALSRRIDVPYVNVLRKLYRTTPQKQLRAIERSGNLLGVFTVDKPATVKDKTVLLVDDTVTTGTTLDECAKMLKIYGARDVYAVTAAGAIYKDKMDNEGEDV